MPKPDIILLVLDSLRADRSKPIWDVLKSYGFKDYGSAIAPSPWTIPSHASIFTGKYPILHGAHETKKKKAFSVKIRDKSGFLTGELKKNGYKNYLLTANPYITTRFGYSDFDDELEILYEPKIDLLKEEERRELSNLRKTLNSNSAIANHLIKEKRIGLLFKGVLNKALGSNLVTRVYHQYQYKIKNWPQDKGAKKMMDYLKNSVYKENVEPKFIMINMMEVHEPYFEKPALSMKLNMNEDHFKKTVNEQFLKRLDDAYDEEVRILAETLDELMDFLRTKSVLDDSLVIVTSDHGQLLGEHDQLGHGTFLHDEVLKVPLIIKHPNAAKIEKLKIENGTISLVSLYDVIMSMADQGIFDENLMYSEIVFGETYGISNIFEPVEEIEKEKKRRLERFKIAVYQSGYKMVFDVGNFEIETITGPDEKKQKGVAESLIKKAVAFLRQAEKKKISKIDFKKRL